MKLLFLAAAAAQAFNLNCTGDMKTIGFGADQVKQFSREFRISLSEGKWCEGDCRKIETLFAVSPMQITLQEKTTHSPNDFVEVKQYIDRVTGGFNGQLSSRNRLAGSMTIIWTGMCVKSDFTGWPAPITKF